MAGTAVLPGDFWDLESLKVAVGAAILSVLKGVAATRKGDKETASLA